MVLGESLVQIGPPLRGLAPFVAEHLAPHELMILPPFSTPVYERHPLKPMKQAFRSVISNNLSHHVAIQVAWQTAVECRAPLVRRVYPLKEPLHCPCTRVPHAGSIRRALGG